MRGEYIRFANSCFTIRAISTCAHCSPVPIANCLRRPANIIYVICRKNSLTIYRLKHPITHISRLSLLCRFHLFIRQYILYRVNGRQQSQYDTATQLLDDFEWAMNGYGLVPMIAEKKRNYKDDDSIRKMNIFNN